MTQIAIKQQIADIHTATAKATKSPSTALKFLRDAGIIENPSKLKTSANTTHKALKK